MGGTDHMTFCGARRKYDGGPCRQPARKGSTRCRKHGGNSPQALQAAERRVTEEASTVAAHKYGRPRQVTALNALEEELHRTQGHIDWLAQQIATNPDPGWLAVYQNERAHLARLSHQMITANVAERQMVMAEQQLANLEAAVAGALRELGHDVNTGRVRDALSRHLRAVMDRSAGVVTAEIVSNPDDDDEDDGPSNVRPLPIRF